MDLSMEVFIPLIYTLVHANHSIQSIPFPFPNKQSLIQSINQTINKQSSLSLSHCTNAPP